MYLLYVSCSASSPVEKGEFLSGVSGVAVVELVRTKYRHVGLDPARTQSQEIHGGKQKKWRHVARDARARRGEQPHQIKKRKHQYRMVTAWTVGGSGGGFTNKR